MPNSYNPVFYFEIPVKDIDRAIKFYNSVFNFEFSKTTIDGYEMAFFPFNEGRLGISGAFVKGEVYKPTTEGVIIYFKTKNIEANLNLAEKNGGEILYPKTPNSELGFVAEFKDSEGNRIALHQNK